MYILYSGDSEFLGQIIRGAAHGIGEAHRTEGVRDALLPYAPAADDCMHALRIKLLILLDQDETTRVRLCEYSSPLAREWRPVCRAKATRFYTDLHDSLLPTWVKDETITASDFVDRVRMAYLIS
jgi:hypothetical protein